MCTRITILIHGFLFINIWLLISCYTGIYAIIRGDSDLLGLIVLCRGSQLCSVVLTLLYFVKILLYCVSLGTYLCSVNAIFC